MDRDSDKQNANRMRAIRVLHGIINDKLDLDKNVKARENIGVILSKAMDVDFEEFQIGGMNAEWVHPIQKHGNKYAILYCHGGGYITGNMKYSRSLTSKLAITSNMDLLCFDYDLAPEHPFPAALEGALKAWNYLMLQGYGSKDIFLAGDSAGGNLALALVLQLKKEKRRLPKCIICFSPWTDMTCSGKSYVTRKEYDPILDEDYIKGAVKAYAVNIDPKNPLVSPLFGDFKDFPPTYIQVGNNEILLNDSLSLYKAMKKDGVSAKISIYKGMWHVFQMAPFKQAVDAVNEAVDFIFRLIQ